MKRRVLAIAAAAALALVAALPAGATHGGDAEPSCADITGGSAAYDPATGMVTGSVTTASASCRGVLYTMWVQYTTDGRTMLRRAVIAGDDDALFGEEGDLVGVFTLHGVQSDTGTVCVSFTSSRGLDVYDAAPDNGCVEVGEGAIGGSPFG